MKRTPSFVGTLIEGRVAWFTQDGECKQPYFVGVAGGTASGKTSVCRAIVEQLNVQWVCLISLDSFYKPLTAEQRADVANYNFDHPDALDWPLLLECMQALRQGRPYKVPSYDFVTHARVPGAEEVVYGADVVIVEGIMALYEKNIRQMFDLRVFVDTDDDVRLARRIERDIRDRGRDLQGVLKQYLTFVKPCHDEFVKPSMRHAHVVLPRGQENTVAINLLALQIRSSLEERARAASDLTSTSGSQSGSGLVAPSARSDQLPESVTVLQPSKQVQACLTALIDHQTERSEFVWTVDRIVRLVIEEALALLPHQPHPVPTPTGVPFARGCRLAAPLLGVSVMRGGDCMAAGLRQVIRDARTGEILIQSDQQKQPRLYHLKMPADPAADGCCALLFDALLGSGRTACMAAQVLRDHGFPPERIVFCCLLAAPLGLLNFTYTHPGIRVVCGSLGDSLDDQGHIRPGWGSFSTRYYGAHGNQTGKPEAN